MGIKEKLKENKAIYRLGVIVSIIYYDFIVDTIDLVKIYLRKVNILHERKFNHISSLRGIYHGKRCFIIATGPSLTMEDLKKLKNEFTFGVNSLVKVVEEMGYAPTWLGIQDGNVFDKIGKTIENSKVEKIFITDELYKKIENKDEKRYIQYSLYNKRHACHNNLRPLSTDFSFDCSKCVYDGYSITYSLLQIAVYMGFTEIYLLGCDCTYDVKGGKQHFVETGHIDKNAATTGERMIYAYQIAAKIIEHEHPEVKIYNATRGGMLEVFPRKNIDEILDD